MGNKKIDDKEKSPWMTTAEAADYLRKTIHTLEVWRMTKKNSELKFKKKGKDIRYVRESVENFYENC